MIQLYTLITNCSQIQNISQKTASLVMNDNACNSQDISVFSLIDYRNILSIEIGNDNLMYVNEFVMNGLNQLKSLKIGTTSFTEQKDNWDVMTINRSRSFHLLNCNELESIEIGRYSFSDYGGLFELSNLPLLYSINIGEVEYDSSNFYGASFEIQGKFSILY